MDQKLPVSRTEMAAVVVFFVAALALALALRPKPVSVVLYERESAQRLVGLESPCILDINGYDNRLPSDVALRYAGSVPDGDVYEPVGVNFKPDGIEPKESAWLVIGAGKVSGLYFSARSEFVALNSSCNVTSKQY